jgi:hypothetical protein
MSSAKARNTEILAAYMAARMQGGASAPAPGPAARAPGPVPGPGPVPAAPAVPAVPVPVPAAPAVPAVPADNLNGNTGSTNGNSVSSQSTGYNANLNRNSVLNNRAGNNVGSTTGIANTEERDIEDKDPPRYYYTQREFWGKPTLSYSIYTALALIPITGFIGLDHMYMRSPGTGLAKMLMNFCTFGMWYFYDIIQAVRDKKDIYDFGVSMPLYGPSGIGAGSFIETEGDEEEAEEAGNTENRNAEFVENSKGNTELPEEIKAQQNQTQGGGGGRRQKGGANNANNANAPKEDPEKASPISFMLYTFATFMIPFGVEYALAGDFKGFVAKFALTFVGIGLVIGLMNIIRLITNPAQVLCEGTRRPLIPFMDMTFEGAYFRKTDDEGCPAPSTGSWFSGLFDNLIKRVPVLGTLYEVGTQTVGHTVDALKSGTELVGQTVEASAGLGARLASAQVNAAVAGAPLQFRPASAAAAAQAGGGISGSNASSTVLTFTLAIIFLGAAFLKGNDIVSELANAKQRPATLGNYLWRKKNVDDLPPAAPEPGIL